MTGITAYKAHVVHSVALNKLEILQPGLVGVSPEGKIVFVLDLQRQSKKDVHYDHVRAQSL